MTEHLVLNRYRLVDRIAVGGTAEVWRAVDEQLDRPVAVKRLHAHLLPDGPSRQRLAGEARAAAGLSHPVIVGIYDVDATGESPAIVMELVDGESLAARIDRDGPLAADEAARITADVADALFHAHQQGVVHRDVKPGNVLLSSDGRTRLVDFGIAHSLAASAERLTMTGTVVGTLSSMAPEQLAGGPITPRTDLYGLGVVLYEALTGRPPYASPTPVALAEAQRGRTPPLNGVDPALAAIVVACLAYDPERRPLHAGALAAALRSWRAGDRLPALGLGGAATSEETRVVPVVAPEAPPLAGSDSGPADPVQPTTRRRRSLAPLLAVVLAIAAALAIVAFVIGNPSDGITDIGTSPTVSPIPTQSPTTPTAVPEWLAERVREIAERCGPEIAAEAETVMAAMGEDAAKDYAEEIRKGCEDAEGGNGNGNGGGDRGGGNDD